MALIERETAISTLQEHGVATEFGTYLLEHLPTIDAAPVVHGRWTKSPDGYIRCSNCDRRRGAVQDRFCGRCGAQMDGGEEHEAD